MTDQTKNAKRPLRERVAELRRQEREATAGQETTLQAAARNPFVSAGDGDGSGYVNLEELEKKLAAHPDLLDAAIEAEFRRETPRVGALRRFLATENGRDGGARPEVVARIEAALEGGS